MDTNLYSENEAYQRQSQPSADKDGQRPDEERHLIAVAWENRIIDSLRTHPNSTLVDILCDILPEFLSFQGEQRANAFHWVTAQLGTLSQAGVLRSRLNEQGATCWSAL